LTKIIFCAKMFISKVVI